MFLFDTNVISELGPKSRGVNSRVMSWAQSVQAEDLYLSSITILELERGALLNERRDPIRGGILRNWVKGTVIPRFAERILPVDLTVALRCASIHVPHPASERDVMIAATAMVHGMTVVTGNVEDFLAMGVAVFDPWQDAAV